MEWGVGKEGWWEVEEVLEEELEEEGGCRQRGVGWGGDREKEEGEVRGGEEQWGAVPEGGEGGQGGGWRLDGHSAGWS